MRAMVPGRAVAALVGLTCLMTIEAEAHPHVWISVTEEIVYAPDGGVTGLRQIWTFDDMFSTFATRGLEQKTPGAFTREELDPLAKIQVDGLKDYAYFMHPKLDGQQQTDAFAEPMDYFLDFDTKQAALTLHFTLPFKAPMDAKSLEVRIYDPQLFFYLTFADDTPVRLIDAPARCVPRLSSEAQDQAPAGVRTAGMIATATRQVWVRCQ
jgi:ABC-type uncharacterized transport system substrate-binding protein